VSKGVEGGGSRFCVHQRVVAYQVRLPATTVTTTNNSHNNNNNNNSSNYYCCRCCCCSTVGRPREGEVGAALPTDTALTTADCLRAGTVTRTTAVDHQGIQVTAMRNSNWSLSSGSIHPSQTIKCWSLSETAAYSYLLVPKYYLDVAWSACLASVGPLMRLASSLQKQGSSEEIQSSASTLLPPRHGTA